MIIHAHPVRAGRSTAALRILGPPSRRSPAWAIDPSAVAAGHRSLRRRATSESAPGLVHRDFHPGNVLWHGDPITGVIDWAETSWGPPDLDVAHTITNFALLHDLQSADAFSAASGGAAGSSTPIPRQPDSGHQRHPGLSPGPDGADAGPDRGHPDLTERILRQRLEHLLRSPGPQRR